MIGQYFRAGVAIVVRHPDGHHILAFERTDTPGHWQLPQGGLVEGEEPIDGAWRELMEETGLGPADARPAIEHPEWLAYEWPAEVKVLKKDHGRRIGQVQRWFVFDAVSPDVVPTPDGSEFTAWQWVEPRWLIDHVPHWRRAPYERVLGAL